MAIDFMKIVFRHLAIISSMEIGIVTSYDQSTQVGEITSPTGELFAFEYKNGQHLKTGNDIVTPQFTGRHAQPKGYSLKIPRLGDPVIFIRSNDNKTMIKTWGYGRHFVNAAEYKYGTEFVSHSG